MTLHDLGMFVATATLVLGFPSVVAAQTITFADALIGSTPKGFESALTGGGSAASWEVVEDSSSRDGKALAQTSQDRTDHRFPLAIYTPVVAADVEITARFKPVSGKVDRAGGVVVRFSDANNYYVARANALEDNVRFYRVVSGRREQLASANVKVTPGQWHTLTLRAEGDRFTVTYDGKALHTTNDKTFPSAGKIGVWTKSDSVTHFDRIEIKPLP